MQTFKVTLFEFQQIAIHFFHAKVKFLIHFPNLLKAIFTILINQQQYHLSKCNWVMYRSDWGFPKTPFKRLGGMLRNDPAKYINPRNRP